MNVSMVHCTQLLNSLSHFNKINAVNYLSFCVVCIPFFILLVSVSFFLYSKKWYHNSYALSIEREKKRASEIV